MLQHELPALVVLLNILLQASLMLMVCRARHKFSIDAPATSGHPEFDRIYRAHMNTLEISIMFLPTLWLATHFGSSFWSGLAGLLWIIGRLWYTAGYLKNPANREGGFILSSLAMIALLLIAGVGIVTLM